ncbi:MAG: mycothiol conjugate amidase Mca [Acidimicrobiia bacterium]|nr:MAG: mycothiol conjugate amidase Mca [Acidimicrobiia bacterium]
MSKTLLSIHAHPDDESSKGAATVARYVAEGTRAVLVTATGGEAGDILNPTMDHPGVVANLTQVRADELAVAADIIGYDEVTMLGYRDSGMPDSEANAHPDAFCRQPFDDVLGKLVGIVRSEQPDVVLGYDAHEFYPHPDHLRIHALSMALVDAAADGSRFPHDGAPWQITKLYAPVFTGERISVLHRAMLETVGESPFEMWIDRMGAFEYPGRQLTRIDVTGFVDQGREALRAHRTQVDPDGFWFAVPTELVESVYPWEDFELLYSAVGWFQGEADLFHGIA